MKCKLCGEEGDEYIDVIPKGICIRCMSGVFVPDHVPIPQQNRYYEMLVRKKGK